MKGKLMFVLFSLVLIFGVFVASCDNGVLPNYDPDPLHKELELEDRNPAPGTPTPPPVASVAIDFFTTAAGVTSLGGDDVGEGTISVANATLLKAATGLYMEDPSVIYGQNVFVVTFADGTLTGGGTSLKATKGAAAAAGIKANVDANGNPIN